MALYLVVHSPRPESENETRPQTRLLDLAKASESGDNRAKWLRAWSPDLHDDRVFTLWDAVNGEAVREALAEFGFLDDMEAAPLRVREWGPEDVLTASE